MSHSFGLLPVPVPVSIATEDQSVGDPALDVLAESIPIILRAWAGAAWDALAPNEPMIRKVVRHDPEPEDFVVRDLPTLFLFREDARSSRETDDHEATESEIRILWVPPWASQDKRAKRAAFLNAFQKCLAQLVVHERDPSWIRSDDNTPASRAYGSNIPRLAAFDRWSLRDVNRAHITVPGESAHAKYQGILARLVVVESSSTDVTKYGVAPSAIDFQLTTGGDDPLVTEHEREPDT